MSFLSSIFGKDESNGLIAAEVIEVNYKDDNPNNLYSIRAKLAGDTTSGYFNTITARPLDNNFKRIPLKGEIVLITKAPNSDSTGLKQFDDYYYIQTVNVQNNLQHDALPDRSQVAPSTNPNSSAKDYNKVSAGAPKKTKSNKSLTQKNNEALLGNNIIEKNKLSPLQPYEGAIILESRFGSSIRFGSSFSKDLSVFNVQPTWKKDSDGEDGDPIVVISNGRKNDDSTQINKFIVEDPNKDSSTIWLTKNQVIFGFKQSSDVTNALKAEGLNTWEGEFKGNQILLNSDRLILNSRDKEISLFSNGGIALSTIESVSVDAGTNFHLEFGQYGYLGLNADEPAVLGNKNERVLQEIQESLDKLATEVLNISNQLVQFHTAQGTALTPLGVGAANASALTQLSPVVGNLSSVKGKIAGIKARIEPTKSKRLFVK